VSATLSALLDSSLMIRGELVIPVTLCLAARHGDRSRIRRVASHPQPLAQCRRWLARELPHAELISMSSTTTAAREAARDDELAAVTSRLGAELYALELLAENIQDHARTPRASSSSDTRTRSAPGTTRRASCSRHRTSGRAPARARVFRRRRHQPDAHRIASDTGQTLGVRFLHGLRRASPRPRGGSGARKAPKPVLDVRVLGSYPRAQDPEI
jgi:hypothetical protein